MLVELLQYSFFLLINYTFDKILGAREIWYTSEGMA